MKEKLICELLQEVEESFYKNLYIGLIAAGYIGLLLKWKVKNLL
jgi:hypothetical protein